MKQILALSQVRKSYDSKVVLDGVTLAFLLGAKIGVVGPNGTHILAWEGGASWFWFEGNFRDYEANKTSRLGAEAAGPHRVTYRKLTR